ncbi:MAG: OmpA family protein [Parvularculaceae bacterium]|nr:OmpA family protein [Parvularculaceae bacterium]
MENAYIRLTVGVSAFLAAAAAIAAGPLGAKGVERKLEARARAEIENAGIDWATAHAEGAAIRVSGLAPSQSARLSAQEALSGVGARLIDISEISVKPQIVAAPVSAPLAEIDAVGPAETEPAPPQESVRAPVAAAKDCRSAMKSALNGRRITFGLESYTLGATAREILDELADEMKACAGLAIDIEGHTDTAGPSGVNLRLSARRATAVADYLAARAPATNFTVKAYGETRPIASNRTLEGRRANRRIEFSLPAGDAETETSGR